METSTSKRAFFTILLLIVPVLCILIGWFQVPKPVSADKERKTFAREKLKNELLKDVPNLNTPLQIGLGKKLMFMGSNLPKAPVLPGEIATLDVYFKTLESMDRNWKIFLHIDPTSQGRRIHGDHYPVRGKYATNLWQKNEIIKDSHLQVIPENATPGTYTIWLGLYIGDERLPITTGQKPHHDGSNRIRVGTITVGRK